MSIVTQVQSVVNEYYRTLENKVRECVSLVDAKQILLARSQLDLAFQRIYHIPGLKFTGDRVKDLMIIQDNLKAQGCYLDITPQYGVDTGALDLETVDNISLRPVISNMPVRTIIGGQQIEYQELVLGKSLIDLPEFIFPIVEAASIDSVVLFPKDLFQTLEEDHGMYQEYHAQAAHKFRPGDLSDENLFCVGLRLHEKQWGKNVPDDRSLGLLLDHFRLHGQQHVFDFGLLQKNDLLFVIDRAESDPGLNRDVMMEARVMVRQLLECSLPYYVLAQIISFQREWMQGGRSEYALAGHLLFEGLSDRRSAPGISWGKEVEQIPEGDLKELAKAFASEHINFQDMK